VEELFDAQVLVRMAQSFGCDLFDPEQLLDALTLGLFASLWRNSRVSASWDGDYFFVPPDLSAQAAARLREEAFSQQALLPSGRDTASDVERTRAVALRAVRGYPLPDDVRLRVNVAMCRELRGAFGEVSSNIEMGEVLTVAYSYFSDKKRAVTIGECSLSVDRLVPSEVLEGLAKQLAKKIERLGEMRVAVGGQETLWWVAVLGLREGLQWFFHPWWRGRVGAVEEMADAVVREVGEVPQCPGEGRSQYFLRLRDAPDFLTGHEVRWWLRASELLPRRGVVDELTGPGSWWSFRDLV